MSREDAATKGKRYLTEGRLVIHKVDENGVLASVRGMGDVYTVSYRRGGWQCDCPASGRCAHLIAVMLTTAPTTTDAAASLRRLA